MRLGHVSRFVAALALVSTSSVVARGQGLVTGISSGQSAVRVTVRDSAGAPIAHAELTITLGIHDVIARGTTDDQGHGVFALDVGDSTDLDVTSRKIGYARADRFFTAGPHDTAKVVITVAPTAAQTLAPVKITAEVDHKRLSYFLSADDIEQFDRPLDNGWDVVRKMRPDMLTSRGGCNTGVREIWVNGKHIRLPLLPIGMAAARARVGVPPSARFGYAPVTVMSEIAPEHIQEITYHDCLDASMAVVGSINAMFVTLKPGVVYQQDVGSFVIDLPAPGTVTRTGAPPR